MQIVLNGQSKEIAEALTLEGLLKSLELETAHVAVELNKEIVTKTTFSSTSLKTGDEVEVVHFVGGG
ncbi:MAG: sulfur carrier protein ThiS [Deltaproteobacteria bacterium]|nr:sulfur carrier protein ThiS [Deltaproteobacteria bacterium]